MKKLMIKLNGEWREVRALKGGILGFDKSEDGILADFSLVPKDGYDYQGCTFRAIEDIKLIDESEEECCICKKSSSFPKVCVSCKEAINNFSTNKSEEEWVCDTSRGGIRCGSCSECKPKQKKIEKLADSSIENANFEQVIKFFEKVINRQGAKINEIVDLLNSKE